MAVVTKALEYLEAGLSVIPVALDGSKAPAISWRQYTRKRPTREDIIKWFRGDNAGIGIIGGAVSGNLERIDFDASGMFARWMEVVEAEGLYDLVMTLPLVKTPRDDGWHLYYRIDQPCASNIKLARRKTADGVITLIETKGESGYTIAPGSPARVHESGKPYEPVHGDLRNIPTITVAQRDLLLACGYALNEYVEPQKQHRAQESQFDLSDDRPGDDYNARGDWRSVLNRAGWTYVRTVGNTEQWRRPGKNRGISATFNHADSNLFWCFSSNAHPFEPDTSYTPFAIYALLQHDGDFAAAASALSEQGYGGGSAVIVYEDGLIIDVFDGNDSSPLPERAQALPFEGLVPKNGFLHNYVDYASDLTDAPVEFHLATGLTIAAAAVGNSIFSSLWGQNVYPNLWTLILAPSGFYRKSTAINIGLRILRGRVPTAILPDDFTREKLIDNLSASPFGVMPVYEFGELLAKLGRDYNMGTKEMLTQLYDGNDYTRTTKQGSVTITKPALSILATSTIDWIHDRISGGDVRGGFLARFTFWPATQKNGWKGVTPPPDFNKTQALQADIEVMQSVAGVVTMDRNEQDTYNNWVHEHEEEVNSKGMPDELQGFYTRLATYVLKFAMLYELCSTFTAGISEESLNYGIRLAEYLKSHIVQIVEDEMLTTQDARDLRKVRDIIKKNPGITYSKLLRNSHMMTKRLKDLLVTLSEGGQIVVQRIETDTKPKQVFFVAE